MLSLVALFSAASLPSRHAIADTISVAGDPTPATDIASIVPYTDGGFYLFATGGSLPGELGVNLGTDISHLPYVSSFTLPTDEEAHGFGYASITTSAGTYTTGTISGGTNPDKFSFTFGTAAPSTVVLGVLVDNLNSPGFNASTLTLTPVGGVPTAIAEVAGDDMPDLYFFTLRDVAPGDAIDVGATAGPDGAATIAGITFGTFSGPNVPAVATPLPKPALAGAALLGLMGLSRIGRRSIA